MTNQTCCFLFVIGPQRSGTTWIYGLLAAQAEGVYIDRLEKENYRFREGRPDLGSVDRDWFLGRISGRGDVTLCADVCSTYFGHPDAVSKIASAFPEAKFVYIRRDEVSRKKSFAAHRRFNRCSSWLLGYNISWALYHRQAKFDTFDAWMRANIPADQRLIVDFADLQTDNGRKWVNALENLTGLAFSPHAQGVVNKSRETESRLRRFLFVGVRLVQATRAHLLLRRIRLRLRCPELKSALERGVS